MSNIVLYLGVLSRKPHQLLPTLSINLVHHSWPRNLLGRDYSVACPEMSKMELKSLWTAPLIANYVGSNTY